MVRPRATSEQGTMLYVSPTEPEQSWQPVPLYPTSESRLGTKIGSFRILRELGQGGMGSVYLAEHELIGRRAAVKILHRHLALDRGLVERFFAEARAVNLIAHANVVEVFDLCLSAHHEYCLVMEYLEGRSLAELVGEPFAAEVAIPILTQICDGLEAAHRHGIVHRDLKPANIFLTRRGAEENFVKLLDFGIAKMLGDTSGGRTAVGMVIGTPEYMAPEQCTTGAQVDGRTDIYATGVLMYQLATGRLPFSGNGPAEVLLAHLQQTPVPAHQVNPRVSPAWSAVISRAMSRRPDDRYANVGELRRALSEVLDRARTPVPAPSPLRSPIPLAPREFDARMLERSGAQTLVRCRDLSASSAYVCSERAIPALMSDIALVLQLPGGELACPARVVFRVEPSQAQGVSMPAGFGVQFTDTSAPFRDAFARLMRGDRLEPQVPPSSFGTECAAAEPAIAAFRKRLTGGHYPLLAVPEDADFEQIRIATRDARRTLEQIAAMPLSPKQRAWVETTLERVGQAIYALGSMQRRVDYDASIRNFRGVARCLAAGLTVTDLEAARRRFFADRRTKETPAPANFLAAQAAEQAGDLGRALEEYEAALRHDPLNLTYQQRYWKVRAKARWEGGPPAR